MALDHTAVTMVLDDTTAVSIALDDAIAVTIAVDDAIARLHGPGYHRNHSHDH